MSFQVREGEEKAKRNGEMIYRPGPVILGELFPSAIIIFNSWKSLLFFFFFLRAAPAAYGGSLHHSHNNTRAKPQLPPTPQLTAMLDPYPTELRLGVEPVSSWMLVRFISTKPWRELQKSLFLYYRLWYKSIQGLVFSLHATHGFKSLLHGV